MDGVRGSGLCEQPRCFHEWLAAHNVQALDSCGWKQEHPTDTQATDKIFGLARVPAKDLNALLQRSGSKGPTRSTTSTPLVSTEWVERESHETDLDYISRMSSQPSLVASRLQLGRQNVALKFASTTRGSLTTCPPLYRRWPFENVELLHQNRCKGQIFAYIIALPVKTELLANSKHSH